MLSMLGATNSTSNYGEFFLLARTLPDIDRYLVIHFVVAGWVSTSEEARPDIGPTMRSAKPDIDRCLVIIVSI